MSQKTFLAQLMVRRIRSERVRPLRKRRIAGLDGDYLIIDELGRECWASEWCRRNYAPPSVIRIGSLGRWT